MYSSEFKVIGGVGKISQELCIMDANNPINIHNKIGDSIT